MSRATADSTAQADFRRLSVVNVSRHFGRRKALSQIAFTCDAGEIVGLLGPNGAGKSTLLAILATLLAPSTGRVEFGDRPSTEAGADLRARIGLLAHDLFLYPELTARENLTFFAELYGLDDVKARVERALDAAGLAARADDAVSGFSRGMRQRVALERALIHDPRLILLDEPFTGLDQASTERLVARLRECQRAGCLLILATHDLDIVDGLLTRAVFLQNGRQVGTPADGADLREQYPARGRPLMGAFARVAWLVVKKDLTIEVRSLEILSTTVFFALTVVLMFSFGLVVEGRPLEDVAAAILWIAIAFSGTLALGRIFERERQNDTLRALLLAPADRPALYAGKLLGLLLLLALVEVLLVPLIGLLFNAPVFAHGLILAGLLAAGTLGFASVGTLFAAMLVRARSRDVLLPVLLYPMTVPVMIAGVRGTAALFQPEANLELAQFWLALLGFFDAVFVTLALWTFEPVMTD